MAKTRYVIYNMPKELIDKTYETVEAARDSGRICKGTNEVTKQIERGNLRLVVMAEDVRPEEILMHIPYLCKEKNLPFAYVPSKEELGSAAGLKVACGSVGIAKAGKGKGMLLEVIKNYEREMKGDTE